MSGTSRTIAGSIRSASRESSLREIATRLLDGLADWEPDFVARRKHIFRNMLYGAAITEMTGIISRRSVYCAADASSPYSVVRFDDPAGNIPYVPSTHAFDSKGFCKICRAPETLVRDNREDYAYSFIHGTYPTEEMADMQFDVIVGNPALPDRNEDRRWRPDREHHPVLPIFCGEGH